METDIRIVIADADEDFRYLLSETLDCEDDLWVVGTASDGGAAMLLAAQEKPDVLLLDLMLPEIDGVEVLRRLKNTGQPPIAIVVSAFFNQQTFSLCSELGAYYFLPKPCDVSALVELIRRAYRDKHPHSGAVPLPSSEDYILEAEITEILHEIGVPAHIRGYNFLREAIILTVANQELINAVTTQLYPAVAEKFNATAVQVERAIRRAIEIAWNRGNIDVLQKYFGYTVSSEKGKPTNCEFIAMLTDCILLRNKWRTQSKAR